MKLFDIPYHPTSGDFWTLDVPGDSPRSFPSREAAMHFAAEQARQFAFKTRSPAYVCVEGPDQRWRLFDHDLNPAS